jgi:enamine deaminase RidA (YjgF/YER057c/UK114 family)
VSGFPATSNQQQEQVSMSATETRLGELGITLPAAPPAVAAYVPWVRTGSLVVTSGQLPWVDGELSHTGRLGAELTDEEGYQAARNALINALAQLKEAVGDLDRVVQIVRMEGNTHSAPGHRGQPQVLNGASDLLLEVFGDRGRHTRTALGISEMPLDAAVQISIWAEVSDE